MIQYVILPKLHYNIMLKIVIRIIMQPQSSHGVNAPIIIFVFELYCIVIYINNIQVNNNKYRLFNWSKVRYDKLRRCVMDDLNKRLRRLVSQHSLTLQSQLKLIS